MSQIIKTLTSGGPIPPTIPTSFVTDNGTAVPAANVLIVHGNQSTENNTNGIIAKGGVVGTGTSNEVDVVLTNRAVATATTSDGGGQTQTVVLFTPSTATSLSFRMLVTGYDSVNNIAIGGEQIGLVRTLGGVVTIVGTNDTFDESDAALNTADWNVVSTSPSLSMQFVGVAGHSITWRALFEYTQAP